jgi:acyl carrier protein
VDRAALPAPDVAAAEDAYVEPRTPVEQQLAAIWAEVLKRERIGATDNFIALGGHSLLAIRVLGKISRAFRLRLPLRALFDAPTVEQLAELVEVELELAAVAALANGEGE